LNRAGEDFPANIGLLLPGSRPGTAVKCHGQYIKALPFDCRSQNIPLTILPHFALTNDSQYGLHKNY
jgi:hypothetical protein